MPGNGAGKGLTAADDTPSFSQYLVRTPKENIWIAVMFFDGDLNLSIPVIRAPAMQQTVSLIKNRRVGLVKI